MCSVKYGTTSSIYLQRYFKVAVTRHIYTYSSHLSRLTVVSHGAKKKQAIRDEQVSYLQVRSIAVNFVNAH